MLEIIIIIIYMHIQLFTAAHKLQIICSMNKPNSYSQEKINLNTKILHSI